MIMPMEAEKYITLLTGYVQICLSSIESALKNIK